MGLIYHYTRLDCGSVARRVHEAFDFKTNETYRGAFSIEIRHDENQISVSARTDHQLREFFMMRSGETIFTETWLDYQPYELGSKITSIVLSDGKVVKRSDTANYSPLTKPEIEHLEGRKAEHERAVHMYMLTRVLPLVEPFIVTPQKPVMAAEVQIARYRTEKSSSEVIDSFNVAELIAKYGPLRTAPSPIDVTKLVAQFGPIKKPSLG